MYNKEERHAELRLLESKLILSTIDTAPNELNWIADAYGRLTNPIESLVNRADEIREPAEDPNDRTNWAGHMDLILLSKTLNRQIVRFQPDKTENSKLRCTSQMTTTRRTSQENCSTQIRRNSKNI